jgi:hypothetical protein
MSPGGNVVEVTNKLICNPDFVKTVDFDCRLKSVQEILGGENTSGQPHEPLVTSCSLRELRTAWAAYSSAELS